MRDFFLGTSGAGAAAPVLPNVWLGTTVESQEYAKARIWPLLETPAAVRFISAEPLLGPLDLHSIEALCRTWRRGLTVGTYLDWVIAGGESGAACRPSNPEWFRSLRDQCIETETAFHFKQWGGIHAKANGCELDGREWKQFPAQAPERSTEALAR
jgi:protein gp37